MQNTCGEYLPPPGDGRCPISGGKGYYGASRPRDRALVLLAAISPAHLGRLTRANSEAGNAELAFANPGQTKHKCPNRICELMGLIDRHKVPAIANHFNVCSRNPGEYLTLVLLQRILRILVSR